MVRLNIAAKGNSAGNLSHRNTRKTGRPNVWLPLRPSEGTLALQDWSSPRHGGTPRLSLPAPNQSFGLGGATGRLCPRAVGILLRRLGARLPHVRCFVSNVLSLWLASWDTFDSLAVLGSTLLLAGQNGCCGSHWQAMG
jgi:hypothetical protein